MTPPTSALRALSGLLLIVFLTAPGLDAATPAEPTGHQRMLTLLAEIAARTPDENPVVGTRKLRTLRRLLEAAPETLPATRRVELLGAVAESELQAGETEAAIKRLEEAATIVASLGSEVRGQLGPRLDFLTATAYLRLGEDRNCVAHHGSASCIVPIVDAGVHRDKEPARRAIAHLERLLEAAPPRSPYHYAARWLLNVAHMTVGTYPQGVPEALRVRFAPETSLPRFRDVAAEAGVASFDLCGGAVADDFDGDGLLDLVATSWDPRGQMRLWRNRGELVFEERTEAAGLAGLFGGINAVQADYDNDGDLDLLVLRGAWLGAAGRHPNSLLRNDPGPDGVTFTDVTFETGLGEVHYPTHSAAWADYDGDGDLDLYVGNESNPGEPYPSQLWRNDGPGPDGETRFVDVARAAGVTNDRWAKGVAWGDYDADGRPDLYVSNLHGENRLYRNLGEDRFADVAPELGVTGPMDSFPVWFWDYDNDGALDLLVNSYQVAGDTWGPLHLWYVAASHLGDPHPADLPRLYRGDGQGGFVDRARALGIARATLPMGANFGDLDGDGFLDFYLGTGYPGLEGLVPNRMYRSLAAKGFEDVTAAGFGHLQKGHGVAFADLDNDGDQDVYQQVGGFVPGDGFWNALYENPGFGHRWLTVELRGTRSNRFGVGARLRLLVVEGETRRTIVRHVGSGGSFGAGPLRQEIGLGQADRVETLEVFWPASGRTQRFTDLAVDRFLRVVEGEDAVRMLDPP